MKRHLTLIALLTLAGCATVRHSDVVEPSAPSHRYDIESGRDAATVAEMRAAPPTGQAEILPGKNPTGDAARLAAQGFVRIGTGHSPGTESDAREDATGQGERVGAEKILLYPPGVSEGGSANATTGGDWLALYFVRFKLPDANRRALVAQRLKSKSDAHRGNFGFAGIRLRVTPLGVINLRVHTILICDLQ
jgi:hypothetical protein